jgi:hypothetical protein
METSTTGVGGPPQPDKHRTRTIGKIVLDGLIVLHEAASMARLSAHLTSPG